MRTPMIWLLVIVGALMAVMYVGGLRPKSRRQWLWVALVIAFSVWLLPMMTSLRSH